MLTQLRLSVLLDNGATHYLFHTDALHQATNVRRLRHPKSFRGIGPNRITATHIGDYRGFTDVYFSIGAQANVLSFGMLYDQQYWLSYDCTRDIFAVLRNQHETDRSAIFSRLQTLTFRSLYILHDTEKSTTTQKSAEDSDGSSPPPLISDDDTDDPGPRKARLCTPSRRRPERMPHGSTTSSPVTAASS